MLVSGSVNLRTPWKIDMESQNGGLEDDFPFQFFGGFLGSSLIFRGVNITFKQKTSGQGSTLHEQVYLWSSEF